MRAPYFVASTAIVPLSAVLLLTLGSLADAQSRNVEKGPCGETVDQSPPPPGWSRIGVVKSETVTHRAGPEVCEWKVDLVQYEERRNGHASRHQRYEYTLLGSAARTDVETGDDSGRIDLQEANAIAGNIIIGLETLFGADTIRALSVPRSHAANIQTAIQVAVEDYLAGLAVGASARALNGIVQRFTKGQVPNFYGALGQEILQRLFPDSAPAFIREVGRRVDLLDPVNKIVREAKTGGIGLGSRIEGEITKDIQLIQAGYKVEWWSLKNPDNGRQWLTPELIRALQDAGITVVSHIDPK